MVSSTVTCDERSKVSLGGKGKPKIGSDYNMGGETKTAEATPEQQEATTTDTMFGDESELNLLIEKSMTNVETLENVEPSKNVPVKIVWRNVILFLYLHVAALYGIYLAFFRVKYQTLIWAYVLYIISALSITAGAHRLWSHRAYKARLPLRIFLALGNGFAFQNHIFEWSRDHRVHHKFSETDADPHNAKRGFFFAHMGWLLSRKHPDVMRKGKSVDLSDLLDDPVVMIQKKFYLPLVIVCFIIPVVVATQFWEESIWNAFFVCSLLRYLVSLHSTWLVNSAAHLWGDKPYDRKINPAENLFVSIFAVGEGYHNYHHTFPWDYAASEWGWQKNLTTAFIELWSKMGLAYDLKTVPQEIIEKRRRLQGDGTTPWFDEKSAKSYLKSD